MSHIDWKLRPASAQDRDFLFELNRAALGRYVDATWGWDEDAQIAYFDANFDPSTRDVIQIGDTDIGMLAVEETAESIYIAGISLLPEWQSRGIGSSILRSLIERSAATEKVLTLQVLHTNPRAIKLYESCGFVPTAETETHLLMCRSPEQELRGD
jgi:ribosomal protein S18 acetylase RimI-like enzyme